jgi:chaperone required for assembly of F1-ATPase
MAAKRFYRQPTLESADDRHTVALDGRPLRTPGKRQLALPTVALAEAIVSEWDAQGDDIRPDSMPIMQLASTAVDRIAPQRASVVDGIAAYAQTDLLCYRAGGPPSLVELQATLWQPLVDWAALRFDASLVVTTGIVPVEQPENAIVAVRHAVAESDEFGLAGVSAMTAATGSLIVALAVREERLDADAACDTSQLEETWQAEQWGRDEEAEARRARIRGEIHAAARFLTLLKA